MLCGPVHAGIEAADVWLNMEGDQLVIRREPRELWGEVLAWIALWSLGMSGRALANLMKGSPRKAFLDQMEQRGEFTSMLTLVS